MLSYRGTDITKPQFVDTILDNVLGTASLATRLGVHKMHVEWPILGPDGVGT